MLQQQPSFPVSFTEADVRRLCGPGVFERADRLQRAGHVLGPTYDGATLSADVRGTWRRVDHTSVGTRAGQLAPSCDCGAGGFCQHAGALLLQWLRGSARVTYQTGGAIPDWSELAADGGTIDPRLVIEQPAAWLSRALERDTVEHTRQIARERGVRVRDKAPKSEIAAQLAEGLLDPANIDRALAGLSPAERRLLDTADILGRLIPLSAAILNEGYRALGGEGVPVLPRLYDLGLLVSDISVPPYEDRAYTLAPGVGPRLPVLEGLVRPAEGSTPPAAAPTEIVSLLMAVAQELNGRELEPAPVEPPSPLASYAPEGYRFFEGKGTVRSRPGQQPSVRVVPVPLLPVADREGLARKLGQPVDAVTFAAVLLYTLGIVELGSRLSVRDDLLGNFYLLPFGLQLRQLVTAWVTHQGLTEVDRLMRPEGPVTLHWTPNTYYAEPPLFEPWIMMAELLVSEVLGRLQPDVWYDVESLATRLWPLVRLSFPQLGLMSQPRSGQSTWLLAENRPTGQGQGQTLNLNAAGSAVNFFPIVIETLLTGPLRWLGFVDLPEGEDEHPRRFRVSSTAGVLSGREIAAVGAAPASELSVSDDLTVVIPIGHSNADAHGLVAQAGELVESSSRGLRYRLTTERVQGLFDSGVTGPELLGALDERGVTLPPVAREQLLAWWSAYGQVRLYDELTVIELADDRLLPELLAATSLGEKVLFTFSPRLIAIESGAADELVAELTRLGHAPRLVEGG
ncbi:MAG TPA: helicase-associated domain-containing protein [Thermomicrobiaceae bacterium]|nr:helicase-associated domain-containing protein [Thermomicrobiaceae bacterium]